MIDRGAIHQATTALYQEVSRDLPAAQRVAARLLVLRAVAARLLLGVGRSSNLFRLASREYVRATKPLPRLLALGEVALSPFESCTTELPAALTAEPEQAAVFLGAVYEGLLADSERRKSGAHHTEPKIARDVIRRALAPLLTRAASGATLSCCDPAMGSGVFLAELRALLGERAALYGVDRDPVAVDIAKLALFANSDRTAKSALAVDAGLVVADFTLRSEALLLGPLGTPFDVSKCFPEVHQRGGFDVIVGNPPWVAFAGRAAQPIEPALARYFRSETRAFAKYTTLHGVFVERSAECLRPGGRLGLVVPTSMADLAGYAPARLGHDRFAEADRDLPDYGADAFEGVFQPAMAIVSTRRAKPIDPSAGEWHLRPDFGGELVAAFVARLRVFPVFPPSTFGERGFQTSGADRSLLARAPVGRRVDALRCGADVAPFRRGAASYFADPEEIGARWRSRDSFAGVDVLIRQTARFPIACFADGASFRNSVLAGFANERSIPRGFLLAWLNSNPIRFYHYARFRDARQGMPQVKIQHLRSVPFVNEAALIATLGAIGERVGARNEGILESEQTELDAVVGETLKLDAGERKAMQDWQLAAGAVPKPRQRA